MPESYCTIRGYTLLYTRGAHVSTDVFIEMRAQKNVLQQAVANRAEF